MIDKSKKGWKGWEQKDEWFEHVHNNIKNIVRKDKLTDRKIKAGQDGIKRYEAEGEMKNKNINTDTQYTSKGLGK